MFPYSNLVKGQGRGLQRELKWEAASEEAASHRHAANARTQSAKGTTPPAKSLTHHLWSVSLESH